MEIIKMIFTHKRQPIGCLVFFVFLLLSVNADAHHVLGRPAYSLSEESNTPPSMAVETQMGDYFISYMVFPAFPKPQETGRLNIYATRIDNGDVYDGKVTFTVRNDNWRNWFITPKEEVIGIQLIDDGVYRQGFVFKNKGSYIIQAKFSSNNEDYMIDFPLQIGNKSSLGPLGLTIIFLVILLLGVSVIQRKKLDRVRSQKNVESL